MKYVKNDANNGSTIILFELKSCCNADNMLLIFNASRDEENL